MVRDSETAAGFLAARRDWLDIEAIDRGGGRWDVVLKIDGTYFDEDNYLNKATMVAYCEEWIANVLLMERIDPPEDKNAIRKAYEALSRGRANG